MICPNCYKIVPDGQKFCENCGTSMLDTAAATPTEPAQDAYAAPAADQGATASVDSYAPPAADPYAAPAADQNATAPVDPYAAPAAAPADTYAAPAAGPDATAQAPYGAPAGQFGATGQYNQPPTQPGQVPYGAPQPQASNTPFILAIIALVTAILGLFPVSIVLGIIALVMNNKQKKQGIPSTRQTPTFVMSLISLILSGIMLIASIALGGVIWAALASGQFNTSNGSVSVSTNSSGTSITVTDGSSSSASSATSSTSAASSSSAATTSTVPTTEQGDFAGMWQLDSMKSGGQEVPASDIESMRKMGLDVTLELKSDGSATFMLFDEKMTGTWTSAGSNGVNLTLQGEVIPLTFDGSLLTMEADGDWLAFHKG